MEQDWQLEFEEEIKEWPRSKWPRSFLIILAANVLVFVWVNYLSVTWGASPVEEEASPRTAASPAAASSSATETAHKVTATPAPDSAARSSGAEDVIVRRWRERLALAEENALTSFAPWMLVSHQLLHPGPLWLVVGMLCIWWLATLLEYAWSWRRIVAYYLCCGVGVCVCSLAVNAAHLGGATGASLGMMLAVARVRGSELRLFGKLKLATLFFLLMVVLFLIGLCQGTASAVLGYWAQAGGALAGFVFLKLEPVAGRLFESWRARLAHHRRLQKAAVDRKVDMLLDRIARQGMKGLSRSERSFLRRVSKLYRAHKEE